MLGRPPLVRLQRLVPDLAAHALNAVVHQRQADAHEHGQVQRHHATAHPGVFAVGDVTQIKLAKDPYGRDVLWSLHNHHTNHSAMAFDRLAAGLAPA